MPKKGLTAVKVTFMTMTLVTLVTAVKFDYGTVQYCTELWCFRALARLRVSSSAVIGSSQLSLYGFLRTWLYVVGVYL